MVKTSTTIFDAMLIAGINKNCYGLMTAYYKFHIINFSRPLWATASLFRLRKLVFGFRRLEMWIWGLRIALP
jgi:hypothetical protein